MAVFSTPLRVLLILILILDGIGSAYASAGMELEATQSHSFMNANIQQVVTPTCSDHHGAMAAEPGVTEREQPASTPPQSKQQHGTTDCCDLSLCKCPCLPACAALPVLVVRMPVPLGNDVGVRRLSLGHPAPVLPHLIRPPIG